MDQRYRVSEDDVTRNFGVSMTDAPAGTNGTPKSRAYRTMCIGMWCMAALIVVPPVLVLVVSSTTTGPSAEALRIISAQDSLEGRIEAAFAADPDGWSTDGFRVTYRGRISLWIANDYWGIGDMPGEGFSIPRGPEYDGLRRRLYAAYSAWLLRTQDARAFGSLGR